MTTMTNNSQPQRTFSTVIRELQAAIAVDPTDILAKISLASQLEQEGFPREAAAVYQDIIATDTDGVFAASAQQALQALAQELATPELLDIPLAMGVERFDRDGDRADVPELSPHTYSPEIVSLKAAIAEDPLDMVAQISLASALEAAGFFAEAAAVYRYILDNDPDGVFSGSAAKALADLPSDVSVIPAVTPAPAIAPSTAGDIDDFDYRSIDTTSPILKGFQNLSITQKQFLGILISSFISITGVAGAGISIMGTSGRSQLLEQAASELAVNDLNYNIKLDQMGFGFRGQSDNAAVIAAVTAYQADQTLPPQLFSQVREILRNEVKARQIEYATLVGRDRRILVSANADRRGEIFDPNGLVSQVFQNKQQIKTSELVSLTELRKEDPPLPNGTKPNEQALVRYTVTPVEGANGEILGALISGDVLFNTKLDIVSKTVAAFDGGYSAVYQVNPDRTFTLTNAFFQPEQDTDNPRATDDTAVGVLTSLDQPEKLTLSDRTILQQAIAEPDTVFSDSQTINGMTYTLAAEALVNASGQPVAVLVRGTSEDSLNALLRDSFLLQATVGLGGILVAATLAWLLGRAIAKPIKDLEQTATEFGQGNFQSRAPVTSKDEVGRLAETFNMMAEQMAIATQAIEEQSSLKQKEAEFQRQERERLQENVIRLLLQIEEVRQGDLRIQAEVDEGEVGSIADAFNATLRSLRSLVAQVQSSANQVYAAAIANNQTITRLSKESTLQERAIQSAERSVQGIAKSIQSVAKSAQVAAKIARKSLLVAQDGEQTMDETVDSIDTIRSSVADTSKKAKRLAESSQEISKIVSIISDISEKTNLLAFNASIEATRAGENGQGFRVVADEVRRLAEQVTTSAQEIEQLISGIQDETAQMMQMMEESTTQVVTGTELVRRTKSSLQTVARISTEIDKVLDSISTATVSQQDASNKVTKTMQSVAVVAQKTASESQVMSQQLQALTEVAIALQESAARFKID